MWSTLLPAAALLVSSLALNPPGTPHFYEFQVETKTYCLEGLKDPHGKAPPCSTSTAVETEGLTLPGMDDGTLMTRAHLPLPVLHAHIDREALGESSVTVERPFDGKALRVGEGPTGADSPPYTPFDSMTLQDAGWTLRGMVEKDGVMVNKWVKESFDGVDPSTGANLSTIYWADLAPDTWTLYIDEENEKPLHLIASNRRNNDDIHQEITFTNFRENDGVMDAHEAHKYMCDSYDIIEEPLQAADDTDAPESHLSFRDSLLSGHIPADPEFVAEPVEWMSEGRRRLRSSSFPVIPYFTISEGTAAATYFKRVGARRQLLTAFEFEFPHACANGTNDGGKCLFAKLDVLGQFSTASLTMGMRIPDVHNPKYKAELAVYASLTFKPDEESFALDFGISASGCAVIWELGAGISASISVCLKGRGGGIYDDSTFSIDAAISITATFGINVPVVGTLIDFTITGEIGCKAAPKNVITAYGKVGVHHSIGIAGAGIELDIIGTTVDHALNQWQFSSGVNVGAWINIVVWNPRWGRRYILWSTNPVVF
ncbi:hypothetical protein FOZ63_009328 [Perkinsus olseni]|uniref:Uncharacterized protein n=1 Tax=Perkinsus olseni TaxID=32597 RepID=A0A7J6TPJ0_PEROL|nr:hypothetical protein FOZ63_009328 [Perkinsus olseni]